ncbi:MAG: hypothetical protein OEZ08_00930 [Betaproteobacteria bacterium]|nr:hypothetical protein [Betaproteobacteria bacterium]
MFINVPSRREAGNSVLPLFPREADGGGLVLIWRRAQGHPFLQVSGDLADRFEGRSSYYFLLRTPSRSMRFDLSQES